MIHDATYTRLLQYLRELGSCAIAFSGGVDSTFLAIAAHEALGDSMCALTVDTPYIARWEIEEARYLTNKYGIRHHVIEIDLIHDSIITNPENRCYLCKKLLFSRLLEFIREAQIRYLCDGTNADDLKDFRPGLRALKELAIKSPLLENGITKEAIRQYSKLLDLPTWDKPAYACLLTRIPYNHPVTRQDIARIENAEKFLMELGFKAVRVRCHGDLARIEIDSARHAELVRHETAQRIENHFRSIGFTYTTLDLGGYRMGSFSPSHASEENSPTITPTTNRN